ncbi:MAG: hypothetical protein H8E74_01195 [Gammaproteobacteria bacterium]|nr:hypothetical protein [Gammaproteobacteria bacterium]
MANRGRHEFSVQEAVNMDSFISWNYEELDLNDDEVAETASYITAQDPAKKVVIYDTPGAATSFMDASDVLSLTINGETGSKVVKIDATDLPFTLSGLMITSLAVSNSVGDNSNKVSVLSFH